MQGSAPPRSQPVDRSPTCLQVGSNLINRENFVWMISHMVTFLP